MSWARSLYTKRKMFCQDSGPLEQALVCENCEQWAPLQPRALTHETSDVWSVASPRGQTSSIMGLSSLFDKTSTLHWDESKIKGLLETNLFTFFQAENNCKLMCDWLSLLRIFWMNEQIVATEPQAPGSPGVWWSECAPDACGASWHQGSEILCSNGEQFRCFNVTSQPPPPPYHAVAL